MERQPERRARLRNPFFTYIGDRRQGKRHGKGRLEFADGGYIDGDCFRNGEIEGRGFRSWYNAHHERRKCEMC